MTTNYYPFGYPAVESVVTSGDLSPGPYPSDPPTNPPSVTDQKTYLVADDGTITLDDGVDVNLAVIGLPYEARFKGAKLAYAAQLGSPLTMRKSVTAIGIIAADTHSDGIRFGPDYDHLSRMPQVEDGAAVAYDTIWDQYDKLDFPFDDFFGPDTRLCLKAYAPRPARVLGIIPHVKTTES